MGMGSGTGEFLANLTIYEVLTGDVTNKGSIVKIDFLNLDPNRYNYDMLLENGNDCYMYCPDRSGREMLDILIGFNDKVVPDSVSPKLVYIQPSIFMGSMSRKQKNDQRRIN